MAAVVPASMARPGSAWRGRAVHVVAEHSDDVDGDLQAAHEFDPIGGHRLGDHLLNTSFVA